jgi:C1A family cysteine protease
MYNLLLFVATATVTCAFNVTETHWGKFQEFSQRFNKRYENIAEFHKRYDIFSENMDFVDSENAKGHTYTLGVTPYVDLTHREFTSKMGFSMPERFEKCDKYTSHTESSPPSIDWRELNAVTPVKDQGQCGSCWSFSATGAMEGAWAISRGTLESFSEQQLVDCSKKYGNHGCNGGLMDSAFEYAIDNGVCVESAYPYTATSSGDCQSCPTVATMSACVDVTPNNQMDLKDSVAKTPVSIAIEADTLAFQMYTGGVLTGDACGTSLDHGVLIVGYGEEDNTEYWLVKNSWGPDWGEDGYIKIGRSDSTNDEGVCGIAMQPSYPIA